MTDIVEKSAEEQLADVVKSEVAAVAETKADVAAVEELKSAVEAMEIPSVEGFVKAEELAVAQEAVAELKSELEALNAKFDAAPAVTVEKEVTPMGFIYKQDEADAALATLSAPIIKAELTPNNSGDAPVGNTPVFAALLEGNPLRAIANVFPVTGGSFKTFEVTSVAGNKNENAGSQTEGGAVANASHDVNDYSSLTEINMNLVDDLPGLDAMVAREQMLQVARSEHSDIIATLDSVSGISETDVDISDDALTSLASYQGLIADLGNQYWANSSWLMAPEAYTKLIEATQAGTGSALVIDPVSGGFTLYGRPIYVSGDLDAGTTAGDNPVYFGDFNRGVWIGSRQDVQSRRYMESKIGAVSYYTNMRAGHAVPETAALVRMNMVA